MELKREDNNKPINISQVLVVQPPRQTPTDIQNWVSALNTAYRGRRYQLVALYDNLLLDGVLYETMEKRIRAITNAEITFQKDSKEIDEMFDFMDTPEFEKLLREIMLSKFYGKSIIELDFSNGFKINSIDRRHLDTEKKQILISLSDTNGISYENNDFLLNVGEDKDLGLFARTSPHIIFKRNGGADYAQFCELFGIPQLIGYYDPDDENGRQEMETSFKNRGAAASITASNKSKIETIGTSVSSAIHREFLEHCDKQIMIAIQGQTMTTTDGTSLAQAKVHSETMNDIEKADRIFVRRFLNTELKPRLEKRGYPVAGGWFNFVEEDEDADKQLKRLELAERVNNLTEDGVDDAYFYEEFGLPKGKKSQKADGGQPSEDTEEPEENEEPNTENGEPSADSNKPKTNGENKKATRRKLTAKTPSFWERFWDFFAHAPR